MSHNLCKEEFALSSEPWVETIELSFYAEEDLAMSHLSKQQPLSEGEKMICHQCFTAKQTDNKTRRICFNKKCLFFEKTRPPQSSSLAVTKHYETIPNGDKYETLQRSDSQGSLSDEVATYTGNLSLTGTRWPAFYGGIAGGSLWDSTGVVGVMPSKTDYLDTDVDRKRFYSATTAPPATTTNRHWRADHIRHGSLTLSFSNNQSENEDEEDDTFLPFMSGGTQLKEVCCKFLFLILIAIFLQTTSTRNDFNRFSLPSTLSTSGNHFKDRTLSNSSGFSNRSMQSSSEKKGE